MATTTNYGWTKPTVGGDNGAWGTILNSLFDAVDSALKTVENLANAALPKSGGTMSGGIVVKVAVSARLDLGAVSGAVNLDVNAFQHYTGTIAGATTFSFINTVGGAVSQGISLLLTNPGAFAITWPASVRWNNGVVPTLSVAGKDRIVFITDDAGATWHGVVVGQNIS